MKFTKMHGIGNDYIYINCYEETVTDPSRLAQLVSDRHFGIGSDGLVLIKPSEAADCRMEMFNADGSEGAMCGNAIRCVGKYVYEHMLVDKKQIAVETKSGLRYLNLNVEDGIVTSVTVDMGEPELTSVLPEEIEIDGTRYEFVGISVGNPHAVYFMEEIDRLNLEAIGPGFEHHPRFLERTNSEYIQLTDRSHIRMRVWERGSGETWACGTGAAASVAAAILMGYTDRTVEVALKGGNLIIHWDEASNHIFMTGPASEVYRGEIDITY